MNDEIRIDLDVKGFEEKKKKAIKDFNEACPNDEQNSTMMFDNLVIGEEYKEKSIEDGFVKISGALVDKETKENLGWISLDVELGLETLIEIIQVYMKKLGKLKTVIEAVK